MKLRNVCIATVVPAIAFLSTGAFAAGSSVIDTAAIGEKITQGGTDAGTVAGYVALGLAVLACAGVVFGMLRKA